MDFNVCGACGTKNEEDYVYCKNCGAPLQKKENPKQKAEENHFIDEKPQSDENNHSNDTSRNVNDSYYQNNGNFGDNRYNRQESYGIDSIDGVPCDDIALYVGKKAYKIMPKFLKMELLHTKTAWCWPAAVLSFLLGPIGSAFWFLYRKMYKIGLIMFAIGSILLVSAAALGADTIRDGFNVVEFANGTLQTVEAEDLKEISTKIMIDSIFDGINIATCVLSGLFGYYWYKTNCVKNIKKYRAEQEDIQYYKIGIASIGGTSGGLLAFGIIFYIILADVSSRFFLLFQ